MRGFIAAAAIAASTLVGCGSSGVGDSCDSVLDCPAATTCVDGVCRVVDLPDGMAGGDGNGGGPDAPMSDARDNADSGPIPDADLGLQGDGGFGGTGCTVPPVIGPLGPVDEFTFPNPMCTGDCGTVVCAPLANDPFPNHQQAVATPTVANLTDDNSDGAVTLADVPDIVFMSYQGQNAASGAVIRIMSGRPDANGDPIMHRVIPIQDPLDPCYDVSDAGLRHDSSTSVAIGDIDGDGDLELIAQLESGPLVAWTPEGCRIWTATQPTGANDYNAGASTIADLDADGTAEILIGRVVIDHLGAVEWIGAGDVGRNIFGVQSIAANLDLLGGMEVIAGSTVYGSDGQIKCRNTSSGEGLNAVGNFDADPEGEFVVVSNGVVYLLDTDCTELWSFNVGSQLTTVDNGVGVGPGASCASGGGGEPTIADFDGDGLPEIALAQEDCYTVINHDGSLLWASRSEDDSSRGTGSSVFDFNGDGVSEVIYNDEHYIRIYNGPDGEVLFLRLNSSRTRHEYPIVADVDNDGNAELVFIENNEHPIACTAGQMGGAGIHVLGDDPLVDSWVPTRRIWNQHSYHITNIREDGTLPQPELQNWTVPGFNNYRTNLPDFSVLSAPDLTVEIIAVIDTACSLNPPQATVELRVCNPGDVRVGPGVNVAVFVDGLLDSVVQTTETLEPGECETLFAPITVPAAPAMFDVEVRVDDDGTGVGTNRECDETNNNDTDADQVCDIIG